jgi:hypothetical protein
MASNRPSIVLYIIIDCLERAQTFSWKVLPTALNGPSIVLDNIIDCLELAQTFSWEVLPISSEGPNNTPERCRRWPRIGPA